MLSPSFDDGALSEEYAPALGAVGMLDENSGSAGPQRQRCFDSFVRPWDSSRTEPQVRYDWSLLAPTSQCLQTAEKERLDHGSLGIVD